MSTCQHVNKKGSLQTGRSLTRNVCSLPLSLGNLLCILVARTGGQHIYLGKFNSPESHQRYARLLAELMQPVTHVESVPNTDRNTLLLVSEVLVQYLDFAEDYYAIDGNPGKEFRAMVDAVSPLNELYGVSLADEFGPLKLKTLRQHLIDRGLCRTEINKRIGRINRVFKWAVDEELVSSSVNEALRTVMGLKYGRTSARESEPVRPIDEHFVMATLPFTAPQVAAMAQVQLLTGMRPSEVSAMRSEDIDRSLEVWIFEPGTTRTAGGDTADQYHLDHSRKRSSNLFWNATIPTFCFTGGSVAK